MAVLLADIPKAGARVNLLRCLSEPDAARDSHA
jgi:hypothetical protein